MILHGPQVSQGTGIEISVTVISAYIVDLLHKVFLRYFEPNLGAKPRPN